MVMSAPSKPTGIDIPVVVPANTPGGGSSPSADRELPVIASDLPVLYEDEGQEEMGESKPHTTADHILSMGIAEHLSGQPQFQVHSNLNVFYHPTDRRAYVSPDVMVIQSDRPLPEDVASYRVHVDAPPPVLVIEPPAIAHVVRYRDTPAIPAPILPDHVGQSRAPPVTA